jgi:hypothetical protein
MDIAESDEVGYTWSWSSSKGWNEYGTTDNAALEAAFNNVTIPAPSCARPTCFLTGVLLWWACRGRKGSSYLLGILLILNG